MNYYENVKRGYKWVRDNAHKLARSTLFCVELYHHGVKGQKWGVRNGPPYPLGEKKGVAKSGGSGRMKNTVTGHNSNPLRGEPNSISDHIGRDGRVDKRAFYDSAGWKTIEIHTTNHGNAKEHPYGKNGEHIHHYKWDSETKRKLEDRRDEIPEKIRKENDDIL